MKKIIIYLLIVVFSLLSCEKDDLCAADTPTTPQVIIEFFDNNTTEPKTVTKLKIQEFGSNVDLGTFDASKIKIPLKTNFDVTKYSFILNSDKPSLLNVDYLEFNYSRNNVYISRACGYKTLFTLNNNSPTKTDNIVPDTFWIKNIIISKPNILNEDETHIKIYY